MGRTAREQNIPLMARYDQRIILFAASILAGVLLLVLITVIYVLILIKSTGLSVYRDTVFNSAIQAKDEKQQPSGGQLGKEVIVKGEDLRAYYLFTNNTPVFQEWLADRVASGRIEKMPGKPERFLITAEIQLPELRKNECSELYCYGPRIGFEHIPIGLIQALMGVEDYRFLGHKGVDLRSIARALWVDLKAGKFVQGGSTLTQQLVKNLFLSNEKSWRRKFKEAVLSLYIETLFTKEQILTAYFNEVIWGVQQGIKLKGLYAASLFYFDKPPSQLQSYEMTILIGMLKGPNYYHPLRASDRLRKRVDIIFESLLAKKVLVSIHSSDQWSDQQWSEWKKQLEQRARLKQGYLLWEVLASHEETNQFSHYQQFVLRNSIKSITNKFAKVLTGVDYAVKIMMGDPYCQEDCEGKQFSFYSKYERKSEPALKTELHQVGSILKPLIYESFLSKGYAWSDSIPSGPIELQLKSGPWKPKEAYQIDLESMSLEDSLLLSRNRPLLWIAKEMGFDKLEESLKKYLPQLRSPLGEFPAQLIGAIEMSVADVFLAYSKFIVNQCELVKNKVMEWEESVLYKLANPTRNTLRNVVGDNFGHMRFFGKTGTSNQGLDNWFIGFDGGQLVVIWFGVESNRPDHDLPFSGASTAFRIYQRFMLDRGVQFGEIACRDGKIPLFSP